MPRMFDGRFEVALRFRGHARDAVRQELTAIVQEALENTDIPIIEISDLAHFQRVRFLFQRIATLLLIATELSGSAALIAASALLARAPAALLGITSWWWHYCIC